MITIREFDECDPEQIAFMISLFNSPDVRLFWSANYHYVQHTKDSLLRMLEKNCGLYRVYLTYCDETIGGMFLAFKIVPHYHRASLSACVVPQLRRGVFTFCSWVLFLMALHEQGIYRINSTAYEFNEQSWRTMELFSFERVGEIPEFVYVDGRSYSQFLYSRRTDLTPLEMRWLSKIRSE